jgi:hypothetical protein
VCANISSLPPKNDAVSDQIGARREKAWQKLLIINSSMMAVAQSGVKVIFCGKFRAETSMLYPISKTVF